MRIRAQIFANLPRLFAGALILGFALPMPAAVAQQVKGQSGSTLQMIVQEKGSYSSNPLMVIEGAEPLWGSTTSPELIYSHRSALSEIDAGVRVDENVFDREDFNSTDVHASGRFATQNQRWIFETRKGVDYDTTRTSELTYYGLSPVVTRHLGLSIAPRLSFRSSPTDTLALAGTAALSKYDRTVFTNYETFSLAPSFTRQFDPLNAGILSVEAHRYQTTRNDAVRVDSLAPTIGWQGVLSEQLTAHAAVGAQVSRQYNFGIAPEPWKWTYVFSGGLSFQGEQDKLDLSAARAQFPYGNGTEALQTSFSIAERHDINSVVTVIARASYITSSYPVTTSGSLESLADGSLGLAYHLTQSVDLTADFRTRYETLTNRTKTALDHTATVGLAYRPTAWTLF